MSIGIVRVQREVSRKLYVQLPELSQLLDRTLARAPKDEYGPPPARLWHRLVVSTATFQSVAALIFLWDAPATCHLGWL